MWRFVNLYYALHVASVASYLLVRSRVPAPALQEFGFMGFTRVRAAERAAARRSGAAG